MSIAIFEREDWAQAEYEMMRKSFEGRSDRNQIELVPLPAKPVAITPEWIKHQILDRTANV